MQWAGMRLMCRLRAKKVQGYAMQGAGIHCRCGTMGEPWENKHPAPGVAGNYPSWFKWLRAESQTLQNRDACTGKHRASEPTPHWNWSNPTNHCRAGDTAATNLTAGFKKVMCTSSLNHCLAASYWRMTQSWFVLMTLQQKHMQASNTHVHFLQLIFI